MKIKFMKKIFIVILILSFLLPANSVMAQKFELGLDTKSYVIGFGKINNQDFDIADIKKLLEQNVLNTNFEDFSGVPPPVNVIEPKQDTKVFEVTRAINPLEYSKTHGIDFQDDQIRVLIKTTGYSIRALSTISTLVNIESSHGDFIQATVNLDSVDELSSLSFISKITVPTPAFTESIVSEGVQAINADRVHQSGLTGKNVKVAVLDTSFDTSNPEISDNINIEKSISFRNDFAGKVPIIGKNFDYIHGTAVAEIIVDVAPDVELYLVTFEKELEFLDAVDYAVSQDVDIIALSAGWINYSTDGSSFLTQKVEDVLDNGILFVVSSGNYAQTHWEGLFSDSDNDSWHEISPSDEGLSINVSQEQVNQGNPLIYFLLWNDLDYNQITDFDLTLFDPEGNIADYSANVQNSRDDLVERIIFVPNIVGKYTLGISHSQESSPNAEIEIFSPYDELEHSVASGSVSVPNDAQSVLSVGAFHYDGSQLQPYSSQGPTNNQLIRPTVIAPDSVSALAYELVYEDFYFKGTSAAAPHVAGVAALILEQNPNATPDQLTSMITENAQSIPSLTNYPNNQVGYGKVDSSFLIQETPQEPDESSETEIPDWIRNNAGWWAEGLIEDSDFVSGIQYMIKIGVISIPITTSSQSTAEEIPDWIRTTAGWWADGLIADSEFASALQYMIRTGIMVIPLD